MSTLGHYQRRLVGQRLCGVAELDHTNMHLIFWVEQIDVRTNVTRNRIPAISESQPLSDSKSTLRVESRTERLRENTDRDPRVG